MENIHRRGQGSFGGGNRIGQGLPGAEGLVTVREAFLACSQCAGDYEDPDWTAPEGDAQGAGMDRAVAPDEYESEWVDHPDGDAGQAVPERDENGDEFPV